MATEYTGTGDPERTIALLWGVQERSRRGPKPRLSVDQITRAAIEIADSEGLSAVSMRRVAERLDVTPMSLYTYVPGKAELTDLMLDKVYGEAAEPGHRGHAGEPGTGGHWRARLRLVARGNWDRYLRHPWLLQVATSRPVLGPGEVGKYDRELRAVEGLGLSDVEMDMVVDLLDDYVHGAVRRAVESARVRRHTGESDERWWRARAPLLEKVLDPARFPTAVRVGAAAGADYGAAHAPDRAFEFGLEIVLNGIEALVQDRTRHR